jgi:alpha,alpha-trehalase
LIWAADLFGQQLKTPECGNITAANVHGEAKRSITERSAVHLPAIDAAWTKKFHQRRGNY